MTDPKDKPFKWIPPPDWGDLAYDTSVAKKQAMESGEPVVVDSQITKVSMYKGYKMFIEETPYIEYEAYGPSYQVKDLLKSLTSTQPQPYIPLNYPVLEKDMVANTHDELVAEITHAYDEHQGQKSVSFGYNGSGYKDKAKTFDFSSMTGFSSMKFDKYVKPGVFVKQSPVTNPVLNLPNPDKDASLMVSPEPKVIEGAEWAPLLPANETDINKLQKKIYEKLKDYTEVSEMPTKKVEKKIKPKALNLEVAFSTILEGDVLLITAHNPSKKDMLLPTKGEVLLNGITFKALSPIKEYKGVIKDGYIVVPPSGMVKMTSPGMDLAIMGEVFPELFRLLPSPTPEQITLAKEFSIDPLVPVPNKNSKPVVKQTASIAPAPEPKPVAKQVYLPFEIPLPWLHQPLVSKPDGTCPWIPLVYMVAKPDGSGHDSSTFPSNFANINVAKLPAYLKKAIKQAAEKHSQLPTFMISTRVVNHPSIVIPGGMKKIPLPTLTAQAQQEAVDWTYEIAVEPLLDPA